MLRVPLNVELAPHGADDDEQHHQGRAPRLASDIQAVHIIYIMRKTVTFELQATTVTWDGVGPEGKGARRLLRPSARRLGRQLRLRRHLQLHKKSAPFAMDERVLVVEPTDKSPHCQDGTAVPDVPPVAEQQRVNDKIPVLPWVTGNRGFSRGG